MWVGLCSRSTIHFPSLSFLEQRPEETAGLGGPCSEDSNQWSQDYWGRTDRRYHQARQGAGREAGRDRPRGGSNSPSTTPPIRGTNSHTKAGGPQTSSQEPKGGHNRGSRTFSTDQSRRPPTKWHKECRDNKCKRTWGRTMRRAVACATLLYFILFSCIFYFLKFGLQKYLNLAQPCDGWGFAPTRLEAIL